MESIKRRRNVLLIKRMTYIYVTQNGTTHELYKHKGILYFLLEKYLPCHINEPFSNYESLEHNF